MQFLLHSIPSIVHHTRRSFWSPGRKWSLTPLSLMGLQALFVFRAVCLWVMQQWPCSPSFTNSTTSDIPLLAPVQYTPWENTSAGEMMKGNQSVIWPFTPQLKPHLCLKCFFTSIEAVCFSPFFSLLYFYWMAYCLSYWTSAKMAKWQETFISGQFESPWKEKAYC